MEMEENKMKTYLLTEVHWLDNTLIEAKMQLGVLLKGASHMTKTLKAYDEVIAFKPKLRSSLQRTETYYKLHVINHLKAAANYKITLGH
jgi:hypothetical protein